jgi:predicted  nucleic acid-binding Zn-ribbon protein
VKQNTDQFYQSRTGSSLKNYKSRIETFKEYEQHDHEDIKSLEKRLTDLKQKNSEKKEKTLQLNHQIDKLKQEAKLENSLIRSQLRSRSSQSAHSVRTDKPQEHASGRMSEMRADA